MSRIILNQIALQKIKVISETKKYFLLQPSSAAAPSTSNYGITPPTYTQTGYSGWSDTEPSYIVGDDRVLYELTETVYSDRTWDYSTPTISSSYKAAKEAYNEAIQAEEDIQDFVDLGLKQGYIWDNPTSKPASGTIPVYPAGSYIASGILSGGTRSINRSNSNTYGLNTWISTGGINLRYNAIDLMKLTTSNLFFYYPSTSTQQKKAISLGTNGAVNSLAFYGFNNDNKTMELTNNALTFYNPSNGTDELATLNTSGLILSKGGIEGGNSSSTAGNNGYVYLSTLDKTGITINGHTPGTNDPKWRAIIGSKFGVDSEGNLYANEAHISGAITATSLTINSNATINDTSRLIRNDAYITELSNGIFVHANGTPSDPTNVNAKGVRITDLVDVIRNGKTVACFGTTAQIGKDRETRAEIDYHSLQLIDGSKNPNVVYFHVSNILDSEGKLTETFTADGTRTRFGLSQAPVVNETMVKVDDVAITSGVEVYNLPMAVIFDEAPASGSVITVIYTPDPEYRDAKWLYAYTFGTRRSESWLGSLSVSEGYNNAATAFCSHAEGYETNSGSEYCHSEGQSTKAVSPAAHSEGYKSEARGQYSHAQNWGTIAQGWAQTALGKYNEKDNNDDYAVIVGNGTSENARSNALTVDWQGKIDISGVVNASGQYQVHGRPYISTELKSWDNVTIAKGAFSQFSYSVEKAGYTPIGVAGFDIDSASSSGAQVNNVWFGACRLSGNNVIFQLRNHNDSTAAKVKLWAAILYRAT